MATITRKRSLKITTTSALVVTTTPNDDDHHHHDLSDAHEKDEAFAVMTTAEDLQVSVL